MAYSGACGAGCGHRQRGGGRRQLLHFFRIGGRRYAFAGGQHYHRRLVDAGGMTASCMVLADDVRGTKRIRSQSTSVETNVNEAFDAIFCVPSSNKDKLVDL